MFFTSVQFIGFFVLVWICWKMLPAWRIAVISLASLIFLASFGWMSLFLAILMCTLNFFGAQHIGVRWLYVCIQGVNIAAIPLAGYLAHRSASFETTGIAPLAMAAGISFYNLQHIAYLADVRKTRIHPETAYLSYLMASVYFPKVLSGPITYWQEMKPQILALSGALPATGTGLKRVLLGVFKKLVLADGLAPSVSSVFDHNDQLPGVTVFAGAILFTLQLYFDFSGYCDMAIGFSRLMGIDLPENFNFPLRSLSMAEFWRRWHMTLMRFLNDYVFMPVAFYFRRAGKHGATVGIVAVFLLSAWWHGLGVTFLLWGISHCIYMLAGHYLKWKSVGALPRVMGMLLVFLLFSFSNVFFRSPDTRSCMYKLGLLFNGPFLPSEWDVEFLAPLAVGGHQIDLFNFYIVLFLSVAYLTFERRIFSLAEREGLVLRYVYVILLLVVMFGVFGSTRQFIYMQF